MAGIALLGVGLAGITGASLVAAGRRRRAQAGDAAGSSGTIEM